MEKKLTKREQAILDFLYKESDRLDQRKADYKGDDVEEHLNFGMKLEAWYIACTIKSIINDEEDETNVD